MAQISYVTILLSALVSVITGFIGVLLSGGRQRRQERRIYGLALLAEIKALQRSLTRYSRRVDGYSSGQPLAAAHLRQDMKLWRHDLSVYVNNSGRIGLFSVRTAIEIIEFYQRVRWLDTRIVDLDQFEDRDGDKLQKWLDDHRDTIRSARMHSRYLSRLLRREVPATWAESLRALRRRRVRHIFLQIAAGGRKKLGLRNSE
jgi:hypothetical protein